jgi:deoxyribodipyrimidine photo-lyase
MWFRRDLRWDDNVGLYHALQSGYLVLPVFIFDTDILHDLSKPIDKRVEFIYLALQQMQKQCIKAGSSLKVLYGRVSDCFNQLFDAYNVKAVYTNNDYEPYAMQRDKGIALLLKRKNIAFYSFKDQVIFEKDEVVKDDGKPYTVYTPYSRKWKALLKENDLKNYATEKQLNALYPCKAIPLPGLEEIGFCSSGMVWHPAPPLDARMLQYHNTRDYPALHGTTRLSVHLRFGTLSIRKLVKEAMTLNEVLVNELIWREFYQMILWHFPRVVNESFKKEYDAIEWRNNKEEFERWCKGTTGYPIVDAGMRELNETGYMHNRVRMICASFLTKHLLCDWRRGEAYFAQKLLDYDLAANNGGWQWAAGCGCDAAPYFRIFNPTLQTEKFDKKLEYIKKYVPELDRLDYPLPIVEHSFARIRCLETYKKALLLNTT